MPTGFTDHLLDKDLSFPDFAKICARAFGALVEFRDDALTANIPENIPIDNYHLLRLKDAEKKLKEFKLKNDKVLRDQFVKEQKESLESNKKYLDREREENKKYDDMKNKVLSWEPPTSEHFGLKKFMLEQIDLSYNKTTYAEEEEAIIKEKTFAQWKKDKLESLVHDVDYHKKEWEEEEQRNAEKNKWIKDLLNNLKTCGIK
jgi:hypothetical protein